MEFKNVYVAVCDILGFKDLIQNNDSDKIREIISKFLFVLESSVAGSIALPDNLPKGSNYYTDTTRIKLNFNLFSDTVVIWTNNDSVKPIF